MPRRNAELHVALDGDDAWSGSLAHPNAAHTDGPFATLDRARDEIRKWKSGGTFPSAGVTVWVHEGTYRLARTFALESEDSGTDEGGIVYRAAEEERVVLSGGKLVTGFQPFDGAILKADVSALALDALSGDRNDPILSFELFFNDERMDLARWPNHDHADPFDGEWAYVYRVPDAPTKTRFLVNTDRMKRWKQPALAQVHIFPNYDWADNFVAVASVDADSGAINLAKGTSYDIKAGRRFYVRNVFEELDAPGEWYYDGEARVLYFWPPKPMESGETVVSYLDNLVTLDGVENVMLRGFTFEHARAEALLVNGGRRNTIAGCTIRNVGGFGVRLSGTENGVVGCDIAEVGKGGVQLSGGDRKTLTPGGNYVRNSHIHHYSRLKKCYNAGVLISGVGNLIQHNLIHDAPHNAILLHGNDHVIEYNEIHDVVREVQDAGAFYIGRDWSERGTVLRYNWFHDLYGYGLAGGDEQTGVWRYETLRGTWAVYLDDNASGITVYGNVFTRCALGALHLGGGKDNTFDNNIIVECYPAAHTDARWEQFFSPDSAGGVADYMRRELEDVNYRQPPYSVRYPNLPSVLDNPRLPKNNRITRNVVSYSRDDLRGFWDGAEAPGSAYVWHLTDYDPKTTVVDSNLVWHDGQPVRVYENPFLQPGGVVTWKAWQEKGYDAHSLVADPRFVEPATDDYRLRKDSPAFRLGFKPIPVEKIGLYKDELRASWPVDAERRRGTVQRRQWTIRTFNLETDTPWHFVTDFMVAGPYPLEWNGEWVGEGESKRPAHAPGFDRAYPPEQEGCLAEWRPARHDGTCYLDLMSHFKETDNRIAYARFRVVADEATKTRLSVGSNDGVKVWVNGELVISEETARSASPHQNEAEIRLRAGSNEVLVKVANVGGNWGLYASFYDPERRLRYETN